MIKINLLDWREAKRAQRQREFLIALAGSLLGGAAIAYFINSSVVSDIDFQNTRNERLRQESKAMDKLISEIKAFEKEKADLLARMRIIEELQRSRTRMVHYFDEIVTTAPDGTYITQLTQSGKTTRINGAAESNGRVSNYIRNIDQSAWFDKAKLIVIQAQAKSRRNYNDFQLEFKEATKKDGQDGDSQ